MELSGTAIDGSAARVRLVRTVGPVRLCSEPVASLELAAGTRTTSVRLRGGRVLSMVEHLFAALGGAGVYTGVDVEVDGSALPLLDGAASVFTSALAALAGEPAVAAGAPLAGWSAAAAAGAPPHGAHGPLRVLTDGEVVFERSSARFARSPEVDLEVVLEDVPPHVAPRAHWGGDPADFAQRIAPARTFVFERDLEPMLASGFYARIDPGVALVIGARAIHGRGASADEPARHKLLDLVGDLYLHGGPFVGRASFARPGHASNHAIVLEARRRGIVG